MASLLEVVTFPLAAFEDDPVPTYYSYSDVRVLDWYLGPDRAVDQLLRRAVTGIHFTLLDLIRFEAESLTGVEQSSDARLDRGRVVSRLDALHKAVTACHALRVAVPGAAVDRSAGPRPFETVQEYAQEPSRVSAMVQFTGLPQTSFHDEVLFLRAIHVAEFCFLGIRVSANRASDALGSDRFPEAAGALGQAVAFATVLYQLFLCVRTMPPEHFLDFRKATGRASAVQSLNFQLMEIALRGPNPQKREVFDQVDHLRDLRAHHAACAPLSMSLHRVDGSHPGHAEVRDAARLLDRRLLNWRGLHLAFALTYLPPASAGTGATEGAPYLERFHRAGLFVDTRVEPEDAAEMFPDRPDLQRMFCGGESHPVAMAPHRVEEPA
ncbi:MAG: tryptophan 2,3-dioxygenase family protein [Myxococcota bacterium]